MHRRSRGRAALTVVFAFFALNALAQVLLVLLGRSDESAALTVLQALVGISGAASAVGSWTGARWAPASAVIYGLATAAMLVSLPPLLGLEPEARPGLWTGAAAVLLFGLWARWYLRRERSRQPA